MNTIQKTLSLTALSLALGMTGMAQTKPNSTSQAVTKPAVTKPAVVKKPVTPKPAAMNPHLLVFEQSRMFGDVGTAISSLNYLIASEPVKYASYADTLAAVYLNAGYYSQCNILSSLLLARNPNKESLMSMKAASLRQLNAPAESAELYSKLYAMSSNYRYGLELLQIQLELQRLPECLATSNALLSGTKFKEEDKVSVPKSDNKSFETVSAKSFILYVQGLAYNLAKDTEKAKDAIKKALAEAPTFSLATEALSSLEKQAEGAPKE